MEIVKSEQETIAGLSDKQDKALELLYAQPHTKQTYAEIAEQVGCNVKTLYIWRTRHHEFMRAYDEMSEERTRSYKPAIHHLLIDILHNPEKWKESTVVKTLELAMKSNSMMKDYSETELTVQTATERNDTVKALMESYGIGK